MGTEGRYLAQVKGLDEWLLQGNFFRLSPAGRGVLIGIYGIFDRAGWADTVEVSLEDMAFQLGVSPRAFQDLRKKLIDLGLLEQVDGSGKRPNGYRVKLFDCPVVDKPKQSAGLAGILAFWEAAGFRDSDYAEYHIGKLLRAIGEQRVVRGILQLHKEGRLSIDELKKRAKWDGNFGKWHSGNSFAEKRNARSAQEAGATDYDTGSVRADEELEGSIERLSPRAWSPDTGISFRR